MVSVSSPPSVRDAIWNQRVCQNAIFTGNGVSIGVILEGAIYHGDAPKAPTTVAAGQLAAGLPISFHLLL